MPRYKILIHCEGLKVPDIESGVLIGGFYTTRYGSGINLEEAFKNIVTKIRQENDYKMLVKATEQESGNGPNFIIEEYEEVSLLKGRIKYLKGYAFYPVGY